MAIIRLQLNTSSARFFKELCTPRALFFPTRWPRDERSFGSTNSEGRIWTLRSTHNWTPAAVERSCFRDSYEREYSLLLQTFSSQWTNPALRSSIERAPARIWREDGESTRQSLALPSQAFSLNTGAGENLRDPRRLERIRTADPVSYTHKAVYGHEIYTFGNEYRVRIAMPCLKSCVTQNKPLIM